MNTIKIYLSTSGRVADVKKDFPLYCGQFQDVLVKIFVPTEILSADFSIQHFIGNYSSNLAIGNVALQGELDDFVADSTYDPETGNGREPVSGDVVFYTYTEEDKYYRAVYNGSGWVFSSVPYFAMGDFAGTNVKLGVIATESNGAQYKSKSYYCRYVRTIIDSREGVQYAQYERKMPREFTAAIGSGQAARTVVINVVNTSQETKVTNIVTSQTINLDVLPSSQLDGDEPIDTTAQEELWSAINDIAEGLSEKQDVYDSDLSVPKNVAAEERTVVGAINDLESRKQNKVDTSIDYKSQTTVVGAINKLAQDKQESTDNSLLTESKTIVGAINEVDEHADAANAQAAENKEDILGLKTRMTAVEGVADAANTRSRNNADDISDLKPRMTAVESVAGAANARSIQNASDIAALQAIVGTGEVPIGTMTIDYDPTLPQNASQLTADLNAFVQSKVGRAPRGNDSVIVVDEVTGETDRNFKYIYTASGWQGYEIPPVELASNGTAGLVAGTYTVGATANTLVNIVGGEIKNIYVKDGLEYRDIRDFLLANKLAIANIVDGTTVVKEAEIATKDSNGDNIATKFAGIIDGSTKVGAAAAADSAEVATKDSAGNNIANSFAALVSGATKVGAAANADAAETATKDSAGNNIATQFSNIVSGTTQVGSAAYAAEALKATQDALGNNIVDTYLTKTLGASKQYVKDYALPKEFNDVLYLSANGFTDEIPTTPSSGIQFTATSAAIGETTLATCEYTLGDLKFQLARKNSYTARYYIEASAGGGEVVQFKLSTYAVINNVATLLHAELTTTKTMPTTLANFDFGEAFAELGNTVLEMEEGNKIRQVLSVVRENSTSVTFNVYSNATYPSSFYLNTTLQTVVTHEGLLGELPVILAGSAKMSVQSLEYQNSQTIETVIIDINNVTVVEALAREKNIEVVIRLDFTGVTISNRATARIIFRCGVSGDYKYLSAYSRVHSPAVVNDLLAVSIDGTNKAEVTCVLQGLETAIDAPVSLTMESRGVFFDIENINIVKGTSGQILLNSVNWNNGVYSLVLAGIGANNSVFLTPSSKQDETAFKQAGIYVTPQVQNATVTFTADTTPSGDIALDFFIAQGLGASKAFMCGLYGGVSTPPAPANQVTDENGNPVTDENGNPVTAD